MDKISGPLFELCMYVPLRVKENIIVLTEKAMSQYNMNAQLKIE